MQKLMILRYLNRLVDDAVNDIITEKNRVHWRKATSEDYNRITFAYHKYEVISAVYRDILNIFKLYP